VAIVHDNYQRVEPGPPYPIAVFHAYASADTPWVSQTLSQCTPMKYGGVSSKSATVEATQFVGPQKIPNAPVHNQTLFIRTQTTWDLIDTGGGYHLGAPNL
jgi:hypothetical protein